MPQNQNSWYQTVRDNVNIIFHDFETGSNSQTQFAKHFYARSAYRHEPSFTIQSLQMQPGVFDNYNQLQMINSDAKISSNYQRLVGQNLDELYTVNDSTTAVDLRDRIKNKINNALKNIFPDLELSSLGNPSSNGNFYFTKGIAENFEYMNLSAGEKAVFDLLLDLVLKIEELKDCIICIDEPELHIHTEKQGLLLRELYNLVPDNSQLWISTHSVGIMAECKKINTDSPDSIAFLDFSDRDFDEPQILSPVKIDRTIWRKFLEFSVGNLGELVMPENLIFCEGGLDGEIYSKIFNKEFPNFEFESVGSCSDVKTCVTKAAPKLKALEGIEIFGVIDRDDRSDAEIAEFNKINIKVLSKRHIESYLFDDEIIRAVYDSNGEIAKFSDYLQFKKELASDASHKGRMTDDIKCISGQLYNRVKQDNSLTRAGNDANAFMRDTLTKFVTPETETYKTLKKDMFGDTK
jgi:hypothetical protein